MKKSLIIFGLLSVIWALFACGGGSTRENAPPTADLPDMATPDNDMPDMDVDNEADGMTRTLIQWCDSSVQFADLYQPAQQAESVPVVVMIHGGCWSAAYGLDFMADLSSALALRGFAVWNIEYRRLGNGGEWPVMFTDVAAAVDYLPTIAGQYGLDMQAVTAMGHSAGGHLALWLISRHNITPASPLYQSDPLPVRGALSLGGIGDLTSRACGMAARSIVAANEISAESYQQRLKEASPIEMLPTGQRTLLLSGAADAIVPSDISASYARAATIAGDTSEHLIIAGADHFDLIDPNFMDMVLVADSLRGLLAGATSDAPLPAP